MKIYLQTNDLPLLKLVHGTVYNMALHEENYLKYIKDNGIPFLLVHGGFQGKMAPIDRIIEFSISHKPELIIAPDVYKDQTTTLILTEEFVERAPERILKKSAGVVQGGLDVYEDVVKIYDEWGFRWVAVPSDNYQILNMLPDLKERGWKIHILGGRSLPKHEYDSIDIVASYEELRMVIGWNILIRWKNRKLSFY